jgi:hypothetical protein
MGFKIYFYYSDLTASEGPVSVKSFIFLTLSYQRQILFFLNAVRSFGR